MPPDAGSAPGYAAPDGHRADAATRRRRLCRLAGAVLAAAGRITLWAAAGVRTQRRVAVCCASGVLVALGVRVEVVNATTPWPRTGRGHLVVSNSVSWLDDLALLIAVRATPVADAGVRDRLVVGGLARRLGSIFVESGKPRSVATSVAETAVRLHRGECVSVRFGGTGTRGAERFGPAFFQAAVSAGAAVCPVAVRYRLEGGAGTAPVSGTLLRSIAGIIAARSLVVEVHLLPALAGSSADRRILARAAQDSVAGVLAKPSACEAVGTRPGSGIPTGQDGVE